MTIVALTQAVLSTIAEEPEGAPSTPLYMALQHINIDLSTFQLYMASLIRLGLLIQKAHCYFITPKGREWLTANNLDATHREATTSTKLPECPAV